MFTVRLCKRFATRNFQCVAFVIGIAWENNSFISPYVLFDKIDQLSRSCTILVFVFSPSLDNEVTGDSLSSLALIIEIVIFVVFVVLSYARQKELRKFKT